MLSASELSKKIRDKKKKMLADRDVIDSGGSPSMDLQDEEIMKANEATDALDMNEPKEHADGEDLSPEQEQKEEMEPQESNDNEAQYSDSPSGQERVDKMLSRKARLKKMLSK